jgi:hypothetical protein
MTETVQIIGISWALVFRIFPEGDWVYWLSLKNKMVRKLTRVIYQGSKM